MAKRTVRAAKQPSTAEAPLKTAEELDALFDTGGDMTPYMDDTQVRRPRAPSPSPTSGRDHTGHGPASLRASSIPTSSILASRTTAGCEGRTSMARVPITVMGFRCDGCGHEWIPRGRADVEPRVCPKCKNPYWNKQRKPMSTYENFRDVIRTTLESSSAPLTWTEIRTTAKLPQLFPNNQWVRRMEKDIGLIRHKDAHGIIHWRLT